MSNTKSKHFSMFGFSSIDPFNKYEVGSILEGKEELRVKKIISSKSKNRTDEYAALITLDKEISVEEANDFFSGFIVADLEEGSPEAYRLITTILRSKFWKGSFSEKIVSDLEKLKLDVYSEIQGRIIRVRDVSDTFVTKWGSKYMSDYSKGVVDDFNQCINDMMIKSIGNNSDEKGVEEILSICKKSLDMGNYLASTGVMNLIIECLQRERQQI